MYCYTVLQVFRGVMRPEVAPLAAAAALRARVTPPLVSPGLYFTEAAAANGALGAGGGGAEKGRGLKRTGSGGTVAVPLAKWYPEAAQVRRWRCDPTSTSRPYKDRAFGPRQGTLCRRALAACVPTGCEPPPTSPLTSHLASHLCSGPDGAAGGPQQPGRPHRGGAHHRPLPPLLPQPLHGAVRGAGEAQAGGGG